MSARAPAPRGAARAGGRRTEDEASNLRACVRACAGPSPAAPLTRPPGASGPDVCMSGGVRVLSERGAGGAARLRAESPPLRGSARRVAREPE